MKYSNQIGFIGLGRMGANMVRRLAGAGIRCVAFDANPAAVQASVAPGVTGAASLAAVRGSARGAAGHLAHVARSRRGPGAHEPQAAADAGRRRDRRRQFLLPRRYATRRRTQGLGHSLSGCWHQRRHRRRRKRLLPDDRRGKAGVQTHSSRCLPRSRPAAALTIPATWQERRRAATCTAAPMAPAISSR